MLDAPIDLQSLHAEVVSLRREVRRARRARTTLAVTAIALVSGWALVAYGAPYACSSGALPRGLVCFNPNAPAIANDLNGNFKTLSDALTTVEGTVATQGTTLSGHTTTLGTLDTRLKAVEASTAPLLARKFQSGQATFTIACGVAPTVPCSIPLTGFTQTPVCTISMIAQDNSGYKEVMLIQSTSASALLLWRGNYNLSGTTAVVNYSCVGT